MRAADGKSKLATAHYLHDVSLGYFLNARLCKICRGDFLLSSLDAHQGILETSLTSLDGNVTVCREGSLPDIVFKIARQIVTVLPNVSI